MTRTVPIVHVSPTLAPLFRAIVEGVANGELIEASAFGVYFPPDVLAACLEPQEYATLRGILLHAATGMDPEFGQVADLETTSHALALVWRNAPTRYLDLRRQISHAQLVDMAPVKALCNYLFAVQWWKLYWNQNKGDVNAPSAQTAIAGLDAIDRHNILTPAQKFALIRDIAIDRLDEDTIRTILKAVLYTEHVEGKVGVGGVSASVAQFANNTKLVAQIPPEYLMKIIEAAISAYTSTDQPEAQTDPAYAASRSAAEQAPPSNVLPPVLTPPRPNSGSTTAITVAVDGLESQPIGLDADHASVPLVRRSERPVPFNADATGESGDDT